MSSVSVLQPADALEPPVGRSRVGDAEHSGRAAIHRADATLAWTALLRHTSKVSLRAHALFIAIAVLLIFVGSVHLGWHYAIDGYVAIIATWAIWWIVGRLLDRPLVSRLLWGTHKP